MASPPNGSDQDRPAASTRSRSGLENRLPTRPGPTPHMDRSISSAMTDSFMLDPRGSYRSSSNGHNIARASHLQKTEDKDGLTPISNWAHLNFLKNQRNTLRSELKVQTLAGAEAKRSVSSLRRLAFRMAVNISVKEQKIATSAKHLLQSRKGSYLEGKDAEKRIEGLKRALRIEEKRNTEVLEALERASMLTLQYSTPKPKSRLLSPPPSPPTRLSDYSETSLGSPRTPIRPNPFDWGPTPGLESPIEVRTSDSRLIQAKQECHRALAACRRRITELQEECAQGREANKLVLASRDDHEHEIKSHQSRIATLERSRAAVEATLSATRQQLALIRQREEQLKLDLESKVQQIHCLVNSDEDKQQTINTMREEKTSLAKQLQVRTLEFQELGNRTSSLEEGMRLLQNKLESAERNEVSIQDRLIQIERSREDLRKRLDRGTQYIQLLERKIQGFELDALEHSRLQTRLKESEEATDNTKTALATLEFEVESLRQSLEKATDAHKQSSTEVDVNHVTISELKDELAVARNTLKQEEDMQCDLRAELKSMRSSYELASTNLQTAEIRIQSLEAFDHDTHTKLEALLENKMALEADPKEAQQSLFRLREDQRMSEAELNRTESTRSQLQEKLQVSERQVMSLQQELEEMHTAGAALRETHATDMLKNKTQLTEFETSLRSVRTMLAATDQEKLGLQEALHQIQMSKESSEQQLTEALHSKNSLQNRCDSIEEQLRSTETERNVLMTKVLQLENDLTVSSTGKSALEEHLGVTSKRHADLESLVSELQLSLKSSRDEFEELEAAYIMAQKDGEASGSQMAELDEQNQAMRVAREEAEAKYHDSMNSNKRLEDQLHDAQSKLAEVESEASGIRVELSAVHSQIDQYKRLNSSLIASLEAVQMQYKSQQEELTFTKSRFEAAERKMKSLQWELSTAEEELRAMHREKLRTEKLLEEAFEANKHLDNALCTARQDRVTVEERLMTALSLSLQATSELASTRSQLGQVDLDKARLVYRLTEKERELEALLQHSAEIQDKLSQASERAATLENDLSDTRSRLLERESENCSKAARLLGNDKLLADLQQRENEYKEKLAQAESQSASLEEEAVQLHIRVTELENSKADYLSRLLSNSAETEILRAAYSQLEKHLQTATQHNDDLERDLRATEMRLDIAEVEGLDSVAELLKADHDITALRESNAKLEQSKQHLSTRLASAEEDLYIVRETNTRLESILERVTKDMEKAETAVEESSKRFGEFITESQAKLEAARSAKLRYKNRLSEKTSQVEILAAENSDLHKQVGDQAEELGTLKHGKAKLEEALSDKERHMNELRCSSDKRIRSLNTAYNALRKEHEERAQPTPGLTRNSASRFEAELRSKDAEIERIQTSIDSYAALEREVESLREDRMAFQKLVEQLQHKIRQLQVQDDWEEPMQPSTPSSLPHITIAEEPFYALPSSPSTRHTRSPCPDSMFSAGHPGDGPTTRASVHSQNEDLDGWAQELERVRMSREETAIQLHDLRTTKLALKKDLMNTKAELHRLEKDHKDKRHRNLLKKPHRPPTPLRSPTLPPEPSHTHTSPLQPPPPSRPRTSSGIPLSPNPSFHPSPTSRHSILGIPPHALPSSPLPEQKRWPATRGHATAPAQCPGSSLSFRQRLSPRPAKSVGEEEYGGRGKRKWSLGLRSLFGVEG